MLQPGQKLQVRPEDLGFFVWFLFFSCSRSEVCHEENLPNEFSFFH